MTEVDEPLAPVLWLPFTLAGRLEWMNCPLVLVVLRWAPAPGD